MAPITDMFIKPWSPRFKWLAGWSAVYVALTSVLLIIGQFDYLAFLQMWWVGTMSAPLWDPRLKKLLKMDKPVPKDQW